MSGIFRDLDEDSVGFGPAEKQLSLFRPSAVGWPTNRNVELAQVLGNGDGVRDELIHGHEIASDVLIDGFMILVPIDHPRAWPKIDRRLFPTTEMQAADVGRAHLAARDAYRRFDRYLEGVA